MTDPAPLEGLDDVLRTIADRVRTLRAERDLTVSGLAFESGLSESRVRAAESGRAASSLATLVALAETFEIDLTELFSASASASEPVDPAMSSAYVVASEVVWGGELPPAPWITAAAPSPAEAVRSPYVVPSEVVWGGELPAAPWTAAKAGPGMPGPPATAADHALSRAAAPAPREPAAARRDHRPTEETWGGPLPPAPWTQVEDPVRPTTVAVRPSARALVGAASTSSAPPASAPVRRARFPRTFAELRRGVLEGREFDSLREFAVAAVTEARHPVFVVARVFRLPSWRLEQWVAEASRRA